MRRFSSKSRSPQRCVPSPRARTAAGSVLLDALDDGLLPVDGAWEVPSGSSLRPRQHVVVRAADGEFFAGVVERRSGSTGSLTVRKGVRLPHEHARARRRGEQDADLEAVLDLLGEVRDQRSRALLPVDQLHE